MEVGDGIITYWREGTWALDSAKIIPFSPLPISSFLVLNNYGNN